MTDAEFPQWMENANAGAVGLITLKNGECLTAEVRDFNDERDELVVDVVSSDCTHSNDGQRNRTIPIDRIVSFEPRARAEQPWPYSDPCRDTSFVLSRFILMAMLFLCLVPGSLPLFLALTKKPYGLQTASAVAYTIAVVFLTFARTGNRTGKDNPPYMFTCPAVRPQLPRLLLRQLAFVIVLFAFQTAALTARPKLPDWWNTDSGGTPFELGLLLLSCGLGLVQVFTNRRLLERAHRLFSS